MGALRLARRRPVSPRAPSTGLCMGPSGFLGYSAFRDFRVIRVRGLWALRGYRVIGCFLI